MKRWNGGGVTMTELRAELESLRQFRRKYRRELYALMALSAAGKVAFVLGIFHLVGVL